MIYQVIFVMSDSQLRAKAASAFFRRPASVVGSIGHLVEIDFAHPFQVPAQFHVGADVIHQLLGVGNGFQR